jgi:tellurite resistance protein TerC
MTLVSNISVVPTSLWIIFSIGILVLLAIDLSLFGKEGKKVPPKKALIESLCWIGVALGFNVWFAYAYGPQLGLEFLTGYLVEKSLSVDNLFVILLIFSSLKIPDGYQHRVLFYGVLGAIVLRAFFILVGAHLLHTFHWILYLFGAILVYTGIKLLLEKKDDHEQNTNDSWSIRLFKKFIPTTEKFDGHHFFTLENGVRKATPLFLALVVIEITDLVFAVDSIPAVFAVTQDAFVAYSSNILAILGLRALYFVLADWVVRLKYLKTGLALILGFIGMKMVLIDIIKIPSWISLSVISTILIAVAISSLVIGKKEKSENA